VIQLKNISKFYYSKGMISSGISKINLEFGIGEFVVITGESGSGKTTLLNVISGLDSYEEGEMYINGEETSHFAASDFEQYRNRYIGNVFQDFNLINSYTVYQNVELALLIHGHTHEEIRPRVLEIIKRVGLESHVNTKVSKLSGGQKQRTAIARALAKDTEIIVADEPTGNLDSVSAEGIAQLLSEISKDKLVIVVTHNYEQFEKYATRKIKMYDGKVAEDEKLKETVNFAAASQLTESVEGEDKNNTQKTAAKQKKIPAIKAASQIKLGIRNTFNILPKFLLLLVVFCFVVFAVTSQYTSFKHQEEEEASLGYNDYFYNYSEDRIVLKKTDGSEFTEEDAEVLKNMANIKSVAMNDIMLDTSMYIEEDEFLYEVYPRVTAEFEGELKAGEMPDEYNEAILVASDEEYYFEPEYIDSLIGKNYKMWIGDDKEISVKITGFKYKSDEEGDMYIGDLYVTDEMMSTMLLETYNYNSEVTTTINGKEMKYEQGDSFYRIVPNSKVSRGQAIVSEEIDNFYENASVKGKNIKIAAQNIFYNESIEVEVADIYNEKTFAQKTGLYDYALYNGNIYINQKDYDKLFKKGNYQVSVYVKDNKLIEETKAALENTGYTTLALKDTITPMYDDVTSIIKVPMIIILLAALFFIAYFVIRLILKSRAKYFSILRMLGMAKKNIRRILDVEMLLVVNIAYLVFLGSIAAVKAHIISVDYIIKLIDYMKPVDFAILYVIVLVMAYLISGKFAKSLFRKTAMKTYREEA